MKIRVYFLAKELNVDAPRIVRACSELGIRHGTESKLAEFTPEEAQRLAVYFQRGDDWERVLATLKADAEKAPPNQAPQPSGNPPVAAPKPTPRGRTTSTRSAGPRAVISTFIMEAISLSETFVGELLNDVKLARELCLENSQFSRRTLVKTFVSTVEAVVSAVIDRALAAPCSATTTDERATLEEFKERILVGSAARPDIVWFVLTLYASLRGRSNLLSWNPGWEEFKHARELRNRLTHPRKECGVDVVDNEQRDVEIACDWFVTLLEALDA